MSYKIMRQVWNYPLKPTQKLVLLALADHANDDGLCWPSRETISDKTGLSQKGVTDAINALRNASLIEVKKLKGNRNQYAISSNLECLPVVTVGVPSSNPRCLPVVTDGALSSNRGCPPIYRIDKETPLRTTNETQSACDDADLLSEIIPDPVAEWVASRYGFDLFWEVYPKKTGKDKACKNWLKLKPTRELVDSIIANIKARLDCGMWRLDAKNFIKDPQGYISGKMWEDEIVPRGAIAKSAIQAFHDRVIKHDPAAVVPLSAEELESMEDVPF